MNKLSKSVYLPVWDDSKSFNPEKQHQILQKYAVHKYNLALIKQRKLKVLNTQTGNHKGELNVPIFSPKMSKVIKEKSYFRGVENLALVNRMLQINQRNPQYNLDQGNKQKIQVENKDNYNEQLRMSEQNKIYQENIIFHNRLQSINSTINFKVFNQEYNKHNLYKRNINKQSRRIFNCFIEKDFNKTIKNIVNTKLNIKFNVNNFKNKSRVSYYRSFQDLQSKQQSQEDEQPSKFEQKSQKKQKEIQKMPLNQVPQSSKKSLDNLTGWASKQLSEVQIIQIMKNEQV